MNFDLLKDLFLELFDVNHLMLDLIDELCDTDCGYDILTEFFINHFKNEYDIQFMLKHKENYSVSCLNNLNEEELDEFLDELFN